MNQRDLVGDHITTLKPYVPGKPVDELKRELGIEDIVKLASNENPLGPSPRAVEAIERGLEKLHIYPDGAAHDMMEGIADHHDVGTGEVITGNGSDEVLTTAIRTFCAYGQDSVVVSAHSFAAYGIRCQAHNLDVRRVAMADGLRFDLAAMAQAIDETTKMVFVANPNNPTGTYVSKASLRSFLKAVPEHVVVLVDEAYHQYVEADDYQTALELREHHERLLVTRTLSKCYGLAGVRAGYGIGHPELIGAMQKVREPFNCNSLAQLALPAALEDEAFVERSVAVNREGREVFEEGLKHLRDTYGVTWTPSQTNFLLVDLPCEGVQVFEQMLREGVILRPMAGYGFPTKIRISLSTAEDMERCTEALDKVLAELSNEDAS